MYGICARQLPSAECALLYHRGLKIPHQHQHRGTQSLANKKKGYDNDTQRVVVYSGCSVKRGARNTNKHSLCLFPPLFPPEWQVLKEGAIAKVFHQWKMLLQRLLPSERRLPTEHMKCIVFLFSTINFTAIACLRLSGGGVYVFLERINFSFVGGNQSTKEL